jgi:type I restriction enzyme S subunit
MSVLEKFASVAEVLFEKIDANTNQILTLQKLRDTLLPKLISGEVRVKQ